MFQFFPLFHARRAQNRADPWPALSTLAPVGPHLARVQLQTASIARKYEIISPLYVAGHLSGRQLSVVSRKLARLADVAVITPGRGPGCLLCFTSPWSHAADDTATNPCVWERGKFYLTNFLSNISFNYQLRSTIQMSGYDKPMYSFWLVV